MTRHFRRLALPLASLLGTGLAHAQTDGTAAKQKESPWVIAPTVSTNPAFGNGGGLVGMFFFDPNEAEGDSSPTSLVGAVGLYSDTDSHFAGLFTRTFWDDDSWRLSGGIVNGSIHHELDVESLGTRVDFTSRVNALVARYDRRVGGDFFLGGKAVVVDFDYEEGNAASSIYFPLFGVEDQFSAQIGVVAMHDSRDQIYYPQHGGWSEVNVMLVPEWLGSDDGYHYVEVFSNRYEALRPGHVLAGRVYGRFAPSDTPYSGLSTLGRQSDLRGYTAAEFVAENLLTLQLEYRWKFTDVLGVVAFGGVSELWNGDLSNWNGDTFHASGGGGLRITLNQTNQMNLRIDYAFGEDDEEGLYVSMGEAF